LLLVSISKVLSPPDIAVRLGFAPAARIAARDGAVTAAIWQFEPGTTYEIQGPANATDLIAVPVRGRFQGTYFGDGRLKWRRQHTCFGVNLVKAGEQPRGLHVSLQRFAVMHVYLPHAQLERLTIESAVVAGGRSVELIDPACSHDPEIEAISRRMVREMAQPDQCSHLMFDTLVHALAIRLLRGHSNVSGSPGLASKSTVGYRDRRLRRAIDYLEAHIAEDVRLAEVAGAVGLSVTHLTALFNSGAGEPPHRYLMRRRFERACELLSDPQMSIGDIAYGCGFANSQHLATVMRRRLGVTPTTYRSQLQT
jgi:AraC family transcriptional regulator